jgi:hypothetical protein
LVNSLLTGWIHLVTGTMTGKYWLMYVNVYVFCARKEERNNVITNVRMSAY